ncbi:MAG: magnesium/cobalt transporter CorA [Salinigranum sp.]
MSLYAVVYSEEGITRYDDLEVAREAGGETWIHVDEADAAELQTLRETFEIHPLAIEDVTHSVSRPKTEEYATHTFTLLKTARLGGEDVEFTKEIRTDQVGFFIGDDWLVTVSTTDLGVAEETRRRVTGSQQNLLSRGPDFLAYRIMDGIVDGYFDVLDDIEDDIEEIEERILLEPDPELLEGINDARRDLLAFRKLAWPSREAIGFLSRGDSPQVSERNEKYFRDVYDHLVQTVDLVETYRDLTTGSRDIYLNTVSQSTNEVMKTLTVVATIFIPLTFVVGVYGMNFDGGPYNMPELSWALGYPAVMLGMVGVAAVMLAYFHRREWI